MNIHVSGKHTDIGEALTKHIQSHLKEVIVRYIADAHEVHVVIEKMHQQFYVNVDAHIARGFNVQSHAHSPDAYGAADAAIHKMATRLKRHKNKLQDEKRHSRMAAKESMKVQKFVLDGMSEDEFEDEKHPAIIAETQLEIPTLTVGEAVTQMDLEDAPTLIFKNAGNSQLNVVFRRKDGNIGWVDPSIIH